MQTLENMNYQPLKRVIERCLVEFVSANDDSLFALFRCVSDTAGVQALQSTVYRIIRLCMGMLCDSLTLLEARRPCDI